MGGLYEGDGSLNASEWTFSVSGKNKDAIAKLEEAIASGHRVSLTYEEKFFNLPWNGDTKFFVTNVEVLRGATQNPNNFPKVQPEQPIEIDTTKVL